MRRKKNFRARNILMSILIAILLGAAIREQLRLPPEERTWKGSIAGVPYDFRLPTLERLRATFWNKNSSQLLVPKAFGMGWDINLYPLFHPKTLESL